MSKELEQNQINEMSRIIDNNHGFIVSSVEAAQALYNTDYRKQSEWISIEERLPENEERVLVYINSKLYGKTLDTDRYLRDSGSWARWNNHVTHWQPLPEAPKTKGGEG